ncbi:MAG: hypothetical protein C0609_02430 [Deltaproteobacteria bacterium]|nr:MAG: hypothetical protein C0609_02430 [Deltaproteobacteria bacterium]
MHRVCAWCKKSLAKNTSVQEEDVSHGICPDCKTALLSADSYTHLGAFLESLEVPVALIDQDRHILYANDQALTLSIKNRGNYKGELGGDFIQCIHANNENGCGESEHCGACVIKSSVEHTYRTGENVNSAKGLQEVRTQRGIERLYLSISTIKRGDLVVLRVEEDAAPIKAE